MRSPDIPRLSQSLPHAGHYTGRAVTRQSASRLPADSLTKDARKLGRGASALPGPAGIPQQPEALGMACGLLPRSRHWPQENHMIRRRDFVIGAGAAAIAGPTVLRA